MHGSKLSRCWAETVLYELLIVGPSNLMSSRNVRLFVIGACRLQMKAFQYCSIIAFAVNRPDAIAPCIELEYR